MNNAPKNGPLASVLVRGIPALSGRVFDYSSRDDFHQLWAFENLPTDRIIIVWAETLSDDQLTGINTADSLSPVDWAITRAGGQIDRPHDWPEVLVIDLCPDIHRTVPSVELLKTLRPEQFPWLRVIEAVSISAITECLTCVPARSASECIQAINAFLRAMRRAVVELKLGIGDRHHAVANLVGPMVLARPLRRPADKPDKQPQHKSRAVESEHAAALRLLLEVAGALNASGSSLDAPAPLPIGDVKLVLVDDQAGHGWEAWLKACIPPEKSEQVVAFSTPTEIKAFIESCHPTSAEREKHARDRRLRLVLPGCGATETAALLLDLRLFTGHAHAEKQFFARLTELIQKWSFATEHNSGLGWDSIAGIELEAVRSWAHDESGTRIKPADDVLLTLLPRFLALLDPTLPIIIFSTTLQRPILEKLRQYGSIFTGLNKNPFGAAEQPIEYLRSILPEVANRLKLRSALAGLDMSPPPKVPQRFRHFELYSDEFPIPEKEGFYLATLVIGYESESEAEVVSDALAMAGLRWWDTEKELPSQFAKGSGAQERFLLKGGFHLRDWMELVVPILRQYLGSERPIFVVVTQADKAVTKPTIHTLSLRTSLDNVLFELIEITTELVLFDLLPLMCSPENITVAFYGATRMRAIELGKLPGPLTYADGRRCEQRIPLADAASIPSLAPFEKSFETATAALAEMGIRYDAAKPRDFSLSWKMGAPPTLFLVYRSLYRHSFGQILAAVLGARQAHRNHDAIARSIVRVVGIQLAYGAVDRDPMQRTQHYFADEVTHFFEVAPDTFDGGHPRDQTVLGPSVHAYVIRNGRGLTAIRLALRLFEVGADTQAIGLLKEYLLLRGGNGSNFTGIFSDELERWLFAGIQPFLRRLTGSAFLSAVTQPTTILGIKLPKFVLLQDAGAPTERDDERRKKREFGWTRQAYGYLPSCVTPACRNDIKSLEHAWGIEYARDHVGHLLLILVGAGAFPPDIKLGDSIYSPKRLPPLVVTPEGVKWRTAEPPPEVKGSTASDSTGLSSTTARHHISAVASPVPSVAAKNVVRENAERPPLSAATVTATRVWLGPFTRSVKYDVEMEAVRQALPGWVAGKQWTPSAGDYWIPLTAKTQADASLPASIELHGKTFQITDKDPKTT